jgi:hypothetical protein
MSTLHAVQRAWTRYGLDISGADLREAEQRIMAGNAGLVGRRRGGAESYDVQIKHILCRVVVRTRGGIKYIVTVVPRTSGNYAKR